MNSACEVQKHLRRVSRALWTCSTAKKRRTLPEGKRLEIKRVNPTSWKETLWHWKRKMQTDKIRVIINGWRRYLIHFCEWNRRLTFQIDKTDLNPLLWRLNRDFAEKHQKRTLNFDDQRELVQMKYIHYVEKLPWAKFRYKYRINVFVEKTLSTKNRLVEKNLLSNIYLTKIGPVGSKIFANFFFTKSFFGFSPSKFSSKWTSRKKSVPQHSRNLRLFFVAFQLDSILNTIFGRVFG